MNENLIAHGPTWRGVAAYHTPPGRNPERAMNYAKQVWNHFQRLERLDAREGRERQIRENRGDG